MEHLQSPDRATIRYISLGQGAVCIFLHGWTSSAREWLPIASELAEDFRVVCWDARGHGLHADPGETSMHVVQMAQDLEQLISHHDFRDVTLVGHSMGALTIWEYIRQFGCEKLNALCIVDQSPKLLTSVDWEFGIYGDFDEQANNHFMDALSENFAEAMLRLVAYGNNQKSRESYEQNTVATQKARQYQQKQPAQAMASCWKSLTAQDYRQVLPDISVPVLMIYGGKSQFYGEAVALEVEKLIPRSKLIMYQTGDHSPHLTETPRFLNDFRSFMLDRFPA